MRYHMCCFAVLGLLAVSGVLGQRPADRDNNFEDSDIDNRDVNQAQNVKLDELSADSDVNQKQNVQVQDDNNWGAEEAEGHMNSGNRLRNRPGRPGRPGNGFRPSYAQDGFNSGGNLGGGRGDRRGRAGRGSSRLRGAGRFPSRHTAEGGFAGMKEGHAVQGYGRYDQVGAKPWSNPSRLGHPARGSDGSSGFFNSFSKGSGSFIGGSASHAYEDEYNSAHAWGGANNGRLGNAGNSKLGGLGNDAYNTDGNSLNSNLNRGVNGASEYGSNGGSDDGVNVSQSQGIELGGSDSFVQSQNVNND